MEFSHINDKYLSIDEAAEFSDLHPAYLRQLIHRGIIHGHQKRERWHVSEESLKSFLLQQAYLKEKRREELSKKRLQEYHRQKEAVSSIGEARKGNSAVTIKPPIFTTSNTPVASGVHLMLLKATRSILPEGALHAAASASSHLAPSPFTHFIHKVIALTVAVLFTIGTYALINPDATSSAILAVSNAKDKTITYLTEGGIQKTHAQLAAVATDPSALLSWSKNLARQWHTTLNSLFHSLAFGTLESQPAVTARVTSRPAPRTTIATTPTSITNTYITNPVIERIVEGQRLVIQGGITEEILNARLAELNQEFSAKLYSVAYANSTSMQNTVAQPKTSFANISISDSTWTGGTITTDSLVALETASTTALVVSNLNAADCDVKASATGVFSCGIDSDAGFPFALTDYGVSTSTIVGFSSGLLSSASSTFTASLTLSHYTDGALAADATGALYTFSTSTWTFASSTLLSDTNSWSALQTFTSGFLSSASSTISSLVVTGNATTTNATTTRFAISGITNSLLKTQGDGSVVAAVAGTDYATPSQLIGYPFPLAGNATSTLTQFNGGLTAYASSTIGAGTQAGGLTISGGATTTGNAYFAGNVGIATTSSKALAISGTVSVNDFFNVDTEVSCATNNRVFVGPIGTVGGDKCAALAVTQADGNGNVIFRFGGAGAGWAGEFYTNASLVGLNTKTDVPIVFQVMGQEKMRVNGVSGNIGIASTSPSARLSIHANNGETNRTLFAIASSTAAATTTLLSVSNTGVTTLLFASTTAISASNASSTIATFYSLTGTYASTTAITASGTASSTALVISSIASGNILKTTTGGSVIAAVAGTDYATPSQLIGYPFPLAGNATSTLTQFNGGLTAYASSTIGAGTQAGGLTISGGATTTGDLYVQGRTIIGPISTFDEELMINAVGGSSDTYITLTNNSNTYKVGVESDQNFYLADESDSPYLLITNAGNVGVYASTTPWARLSVDTSSLAAGVPSFVVGSSTRTDLVVTQSGNVGIGVTSPATRLTVQTAASSYGIQHTDGSIRLSTFLGFSAGWIGTVSNHPLFFYTNDSSEQAVLSTAGNFGIGTTSPWGKLSVTNTGSNPSFVVEDSTSPDSSPFIVQADGTVGIGTASTTAADAAAKLFVVGGGPVGAKANVTAVFKESDTSTKDAQLAIGVTNGNRPFIAALNGVTGAASLDFYTNNDLRMRIVESTGNVGIGDSSPAALLTVGNGDLFQVDSSGAIVAATGITSSGSITFSGLTANRLVVTTTGGALTNSITLANLIASLSDVSGSTGSTNLVLSASPTFTGTITAAAATLSGTLTANGTFAANGAVTLGDGGDDIAVNSNDWDISSAGVASGFTGLTSSGSITFSGLTASRAVCTTTGGLLTVSCASSDIAASVSDEQGSGALVFATSPTLTSLTVSSGGLTVSSGGITIDAGGLTVNSGTITIPISSNTTDRGTLCINTTTGVVTTDLDGNNCDTSSLRFKKDVEYLEFGGLEMVRQFKPAEFTRIRTDRRERGFIAEDMAEIHPLLVWYDEEGRPNSLSEYAIIGVIADAVQELDLNLETIASTTASSTPQSLAFAERFMNGIFARITTWLADAGNDIADFFAERVHADLVYTRKIQTDELCVGSVCVTEAEFLNMVQKSKETSTGNALFPQSNSEGTEEIEGAESGDPPPASTEETESGGQEESSLGEASSGEGAPVEEVIQE